jgi:hypothetical protein
MKESLAALHPKFAGVVFGKHLAADGEAVAVLCRQRRGKKNEGESRYAATRAMHREISRLGEKVRSGRGR